MEVAFRVGRPWSQLLPSLCVHGRYASHCDEHKGLVGSFLCIAVSACSVAPRDPFVKGEPRICLEVGI